jgi:hypothetical protein
MKLNAPTKIVWFISLILAVLGVVFSLAGILEAWNFWIVVVAWILMFLGTILKGF